MLALLFNKLWGLHLCLSPATLFKKRFWRRCFPVDFAKFLRTLFLQNTSGGSFWGFSEHLFYRAPLRNYLFHVQVAEFQPADTVINYFSGAFQAFYTRTRRNHSKAFIYLESLRIISEGAEVGLSPATLLKRSLWHSCFPVNFVKFLNAPFFTEHLCWLILKRLIRNEVAANL